MSWYQWLGPAKPESGTPWTPGAKLLGHLLLSPTAAAAAAGREVEQP